MDYNRENIKGVKNIHEYIQRIFISMKTLYNISKKFHDELYSLQNDLNFRQISDQLIDTYNRYIKFFYDQIKSVLMSYFISEDSKEILIIKPVRDNKYCQDIEFTYFTNDILSIKTLGSVTTMSINKINDEIIYLRGNRKFTFILLDFETKLTILELREHIEFYIKMIKEIIGWLYSDIKSIKLSIKILIDIICEITNNTPKKYIKEWVELLEEIKNTTNEID
jgi:hypothetical protein